MFSFLFFSVVNVAVVVFSKVCDIVGCRSMLLMPKQNINVMSIKTDGNICFKIRTSSATSRIKTEDDCFPVDRSFSLVLVNVRYIRQTGHF